MLLRITLALGALVSFLPSAFPAVQPFTTPFEAIHTQLFLKPGQTYLNYMRKQVKPGLDAYNALIEDSPALKRGDFRQLQLDLIKVGAGVAIRIDSRNYIFNIGYLNGSDPHNDVKSGRSYGVGPTGRQSDPSDLAYLSELEAYLKSEPQATGAFVEALMLVITNCDTSGWSKLSVAGQIVATDFLAIYTAELDRHMMVRLHPSIHPWEIDLAAATFVSVFNTATGLMMKNGSLIPGSIRGWWAQGRQGSGIGETRRDRISLQQRIARILSMSEETQQLPRIIGSRQDQDMVQHVLEFLSSGRAPAQFSGSQASQLSEIVRDHVLNFRARAAEIARGR